MARDRFVVDHVLQVRDRMAEAIARARQDSEPTLVEVRTYRFRGHSMSDPGKYRTPEELEEHKKRDAVLRSRAELVEKGLGAGVEKVEAEVEETVADAVRFAEESPEPGPEILEETTYKGAFAR
jgi:pyruvate dehydrogenase E1 component alpha subunit